MLQAYFDGSGEHSSTDFVCMAGYTADADHWESFSHAWHALLVKYRLSAVHMRQLMHFRGEYASLGWTETTRDEVLSEFAFVIRQHVQLGVAAGIDSQFYRTMPRDAQKRMGDPQRFVFSRCLRLLIDKLREREHDVPIALIFDDDEKYAMKCYADLVDIKRGNADVKARIGSICFGNHRVVQALQGADVLAYLSLRYLKAQLAGGSPPPHFEQLLRAPDPAYGIEYTSELWDAEEMQRRFIGSG
jgi:Protein of unknown function (DUF3800)